VFRGEEEGRGELSEINIMAISEDRMKLVD
jgi:hypothetical protein